MGCCRLSGFESGTCWTQSSSTPFRGRRTQVKSGPLYNQLRHQNQSKWEVIVHTLSHSWVGSMSDMPRCAKLRIIFALSHRSFLKGLDRIAPAGPRDCFSQCSSSSTRRSLYRARDAQSLPAVDSLIARPFPAVVMTALAACTRWGCILDGSRIRMVSLVSFTLVVLSSRVSSFAGNDRSGGGPFPPRTWDQ